MATQAAPDEGQAPTPSTILSIPITKGKGSVDVDTAAIPGDVYAEALKLGLKELANRGMSKITKAAFPNDEEGMKAAAMAQAQKNLEAIMSSNIRFSGGAKTSKVSGEVKTEAMRIAKADIKTSLKKLGYKLSTIPAREITALAKELLESDPSILKQAEANIADRQKVSVSKDILKKVKVDPKLVAKVEAEKAKRKETLSATQAGKPAPRVKKKKAQPQANA